MILHNHNKPDPEAPASERTFVLGQMMLAPAFSRNLWRLKSKSKSKTKGKN